MKSLETLQKTFRVFQILTKIAMILSFVWAGLAALGVLCGVVWSHGGTVVGADRELLYSLTSTGGLTELIGTLLRDTIFGLTDGVLLAFALRYFQHEQAAGTPFTEAGVVEIRRLGIRTIVMPLVASILAAVVSAIFELSQTGGDLNGVPMGIVLILASLVFRCGADLQAEHAPN